MKWRPEEAGKIVSLVGGGFCGRANNDEEAVGLCIIHNVDIDALTAERDELQRRLGEIAKHAAAPNWGDIVCAGGKLELATTRLDEIRAIAEGRDNG